MRSRCFLVVGQEIGAYLPATLEPLGKVLLARTVEEASRILVEERKSLTGLFVNVDLPDGCGFDIVEKARALDMEVPALAVSSHTGPQFGREANRGQLLDTPCLPDPVKANLLLHFIDRSDKAAADDDAADELFVQRHSAETGMPLEEVKANIQGILEKTGARTLAEVMRRLHRESFKREESRRRTGMGLEDPSTLH